MRLTPSIRRGNVGENFLTYICWSHHTTDLFHGIQIRAETTVHGEDLLVNDCCDWKAIEAIGKGLPELDIISPLALVVEAIDTIDRRALVVSSQDKEVLGILDLVGQEQADCLQGLFASVNIVPKEQVIGFWRETTVFE